MSKELYTITKDLKVLKIPVKDVKYFPYKMEIYPKDSVEFLGKKILKILKIKKCCLFKEVKYRFIELFNREGDNINLSSEEIKVITKMFFEKYKFDYINNKIKFDEEEYDLSEYYIIFDSKPLSFLRRLNEKDLNSIYSEVYLERLEKKKKFLKEELEIVYSQMYYKFNKEPLVKFRDNEAFLFKLEEDKLVLYDGLNYFLI